MNGKVGKGGSWVSPLFRYPSFSSLWCSHATDGQCPHVGTNLRSAQKPKLVAAGSNQSENQSYTNSECNLHGLDDGGAYGLMLTGVPRHLLVRSTPLRIPRRRYHLNCSSATRFICLSSCSCLRSVVRVCTRCFRSRLSPPLNACATAPKAPPQHPHRLTPDLLPTNEEAGSLQGLAKGEGWRARVPLESPQRPLRFALSPPPESSASAWIAAATAAAVLNRSSVGGKNRAMRMDDVSRWQGSDAGYGSGSARDVGWVGLAGWLGFGWFGC
jgi:hypothetical protein